ncbi:hypothetical protein [Variovorax paradoxus]|uniref:hypothetical protein n=1 Tax=Variovorax paradoxus TaxID=34073 RepID=UPI0029C92E70|nr:hypothetical protein [Variovorax paradoxus]WPH22303.1 hypothetical protein RZE78_09095 [Variovorax paradoxus]
MTESTFTPPVPSGRDGAYAWAKVGLALIPTANEILPMILQPPLERRRQAWMEAVGKRLLELESTGEVDFEKLQQNEEFVSTVLQASAAAIKAHQQEKLDAFKNAVINVARGQAPEDALLHLFLNYVDQLSVFQIQMMQVMSNPTIPPGMSVGGLSHVLEHNMPHARGKEPIYRKLWADLEARGLVQGNMGATMSAGGLQGNKNSDLGRRFLEFISA